MKVNTDVYEGYLTDVVQRDVSWQRDVYAAPLSNARPVASDGKRYEDAERALIAARAAVDEVLGRAI